MQVKVEVKDIPIENQILFETHVGNNKGVYQLVGYPNQYLVNTGKLLLYVWREGTYQGVSKGESMLDYSRGFVRTNNLLTITFQGD